MSKPFIFVVLSVVLMLVLECNNGGGDVAGTLSETQNSGLVRGRVLNSDGYPAAGVMVRFVSADHDPGANGTSVTLKAKDSCYTNADGYYSTDSLSKGTWNILAADAGDRNKVFMDSLTFTGDTLKVKDASLAIPGAVRGAVKVRRGDDPRNVSVFVIGALAYSMAENDGGFSLASMAKGRYRLRVRAYDPKYEIVDTVVDVASGLSKVIDSPIVLPLKIPTPTGLTVSYDTLKQMVTLRWNTMDARKVRTYNVYRQRIDTMEIKLNTLPYAETLFVDSTAVQDMRYIYSIASVDSLGNVGTEKAVYKDTVTIKPAFDLVATFGGPGTGDGKFTEIRDIKCLRDGRLIVLDAGTSVVQVFDTMNNFLNTWGKFGSGNGEFNMPNSVAEDDSGNIYILEYWGMGRIQKFNSSGVFVKSWTIGQTYTDVTYNNNKIYIVGELHQHIKVVNLISGEITDIPLGNNRSFSTIAYVKGSNVLVMTEYLNNEIIFADTNGNILKMWGGTGSNNGEFQGVGSISISNTRDIYAADKANGRFQVFSISGTFLTSIYIPNRDNCISYTCSDVQSVGITLNDSGAVFVADRYYLKKFVPKE